MKTRVDDDYLICNEYHENIEKKSSVYPEFITFQHANGNFYFAWVHENSIVLRSEAYPDEEKMERGIQAVLKNRDIAERYKVIESHGAHFLCLMGGGDHMKHTGYFENHNEVGRSCPKKSRQELHHLLLVKGKAFADKVIPLSASDMTAPIAGAAASFVASTMVEKEKTVSGTASTASHYATNTNEAKKIVSAAAHTAPAAEASGGFNWKWLLPLLLLIPLFFVYKNCSGKSGGSATSGTTTTSSNVETTTPGTTTVQTTDTSQVVAGNANAAASTTKSSETPAAASATPSCNLHWILYDFNQATIRSDAQAELSNMAKLLKENPEWLGVIDAHTDGKGSDDYNKKLSLSRAANAKAVLVKLGIDASRITATASSEGDPIASNTDDDSGRQYNRRSELYIKDKTGKEVCKSIAPEVPGSLKVK